MRYRLGIDIGGTNTDAAILDNDNRILAKGKTPVTSDVITGIAQVVGRVLSEARLNPEDISHAMLGTTQVTNAIIERKGLARVGIVRLGAPATKAVPPLAGWPQDLRKHVEGPGAILPGGVEFDGRPISRFDRDAVRRMVVEARDKVQAFAVASVFSPVRNDDEQKAAEIIAEETSAGTPISLSNEIGSVGLLERENATILNAAVTPVARRVTHAFKEALAQLGIQAQLFLSQNDGTLMSLDYALQYPILTIACGPTNSIRGAAFLSGLNDAIVVDVGGTSTDVGVLASGFPRESAVAVEIGGVRTNFRMPDLVSIGLGGGSIVYKDEDGEVCVGPESVGYAILQEALCFGGQTLTMTDVAVARGMADLGERSRIQVASQTLEQAYQRSVELVEEAVDRMKISANDVPLVAVGGGSILLPDKLSGISQVYKPEHFEVANAIGAAIAQVSGTVDRIFSLENRSREAVLQEARESAFHEAIRAGADPSTLELIEVEEVPLAYLPGNATRVKMKAAGKLKS
ncbi:hydantoinase/oxoprolinase family protein [Ktedonosporobacter rubrisoli]|uniref:Hydantoinase/oxoprolinase family protein n=1 Tax=Ktedonosporobacter rubrisoli TaxID=2509675 RepID=A0A4P6K0F8_KTERU|nr:hydantoinase/oxoprolinase family protein [Ktedonosporobacter rubrisoli]QBD81283.1 hydantoinase/oxoprolinase family protein [Ktedonosporobacter rubrisoli]